MLSTLFVITAFITKRDLKSSRSLFGPFWKDLLQIVTNRECLTNFKRVITKCDKELLQCDKELLQNMTGIRKLTEFITKCERYYIIRPSNYNRDS